QAEDGIRDRNVTGVQTCALPISFSDALFACPERREPLVACWPAGLLPTAVSAGHFLLSVVPVPAPIASLAAARLHFLCVAVHSLGGQHATAAEAARSCVSTRAESPRTSDPISGNLR